MPDDSTSEALSSARLRKNALLEDRPDLIPHRQRLWKLIEATPFLDWQLLTKRPQNFLRFLPKDWIQSPRHNVWLMTSVESPEYLWRIDALIKCPAVVHGLSIEPLLAPIPTLIDHLAHIEWVIVGGESGRRSQPIRPMHPDWVRDIRNQCQMARVPFFFKQWGEHNSDLVWIGKKKAGRELDGRTWDETPQPDLDQAATTSDESDGELAADDLLARARQYLQQPDADPTIRNVLERLLKAYEISPSPRFLENIKALLPEPIEPVPEPPPSIEFPEPEPPKPPEPVTEKGWPQPAVKAFTGYMGEYIHFIKDESEADPHGILFNLLVHAGAVIGSRPHCKTADSKQSVAEYCCIVGKSARSRKGTGRDRVGEFMSRVAPDFTNFFAAIASGEGLIKRFHEMENAEIYDNRLLCSEGEFARLLETIKQRPTLSADLRDARDGKRISRSPKSGTYSCDNPHLCISGDTTPTELRKSVGGHSNDERVC